MSASGWIEKYGNLPEAIGNKKVIFEATTGTMVQVAERVWGRGELTNGGTITYNENYDLYAYTPPAPRKVSGKGKPYELWKNPPKGKTGARDIKGGWYKSWLTFKDDMGRKDLPFELTGRFRKAWFGGVRPEPREQDALTCVIDLPASIAKQAQGLGETKGIFLELTEQEKKDHHERVADIYRIEVLGQ